MNMQKERSHSIRFAFNENRLCISMEVLRAIGSPKYVQMFVNRNRKIFFIRGCVKKESQSFSVPPRVYADTEYKYRLQKAAFSEALQTATGLDGRGKYRFYGVLVSGCVMAFPFDDAQRLDGHDEL